MSKVNNIFVNLLTTLVLLVLASCSSVISDEGKTSQNKYRYLHNCTIQGKPITRFITAKVPLTTKELKQLKQTLEENFQLDHGSCVYVETKS